MPTCPECGSELVSVRYELWVDFFEDNRREVDQLDLEESEPLFGDSALCRMCGFAWIYGVETPDEDRALNGRGFV